MTNKQAEIVRESLKKRHRTEKLFRFVGVVAISIAVGFVFLMIGTIAKNGLPAFTETQIALKTTITLEDLGIEEGVDSRLIAEELAKVDYQTLIRSKLREKYPEFSKRKQKKELYKTVSSGGDLELRDQLKDDPSLIGKEHKYWLTASSNIDLLHTGVITEEMIKSGAKVTQVSVDILEALQSEDAVRTVFNTYFFKNGTSRDPELAGIRAAAAGSFYTLLVTLAISFPIGIGAAIYLEEFAPKNRFTDLIEVNINNLAAVPSIIFGLLGLAVYINFFGLPRSVPFVGGLVLSLMTLPTIIIAARAAIKSVPPSIQDAALGLGASKTQSVFHHTIPLAMPGILTGTIIGMAQALGETAPLLMIGMVAFIVDVPQGLFDSSTVLPVQIFLWADSPERGFVARTSAAILVLLAFLICMNLLAVYLRKRFEKRW